MEYKSIDEFLKEKGLTPEELEQHKYLINECREREESLKKINNAEGLKKFFDIYNQILGVFVGISGETEGVTGMLEKTINNGKNALENINQNNKDLNQIYKKEHQICETQKKIGEDMEKTIENVTEAKINIDRELAIKRAKIQHSGYENIPEDYQN